MPIFNVRGKSRLQVSLEEILHSVSLSLSLSLSVSFSLCLSLCLSISLVFLTQLIFLANVDHPCKNNFVYFSWIKSSSFFQGSVKLLYHGSIIMMFYWWHHIFTNLTCHIQGRPGVWLDGICKIVRKCFHNDHVGPQSMLGKVFTSFEHIQKKGHVRCTMFWPHFASRLKPLTSI